MEVTIDGKPYRIALLSISAPCVIAGDLVFLNPAKLPDRSDAAIVEYARQAISAATAAT